MRNKTTRSLLRILCKTDMALKSPGRNRSSHNARAVAREVIRKVQNGEKVVIKEIVAAQGYSKTTVHNANVVTNTQSYKDEIESYAARLERHRLKILKAMEDKDLSQEQYRTLADAQTKVTHDVQLLTGGKTENLGVQEDRLTLINILAEIRGGAPTEQPKIHEHDRGPEKQIEGTA